MLNKFASLMVVATLVTTGLQATEGRTEEKAAAAPTTIVIEQKKVTVKDEATSREDSLKAPVLAACDENCGTTVSTPEEEIELQAELAACGSCETTVSTPDEEVELPVETV